MINKRWIRRIGVAIFSFATFCFFGVTVAEMIKIVQIEREDRRTARQFLYSSFAQMYFEYGRVRHELSLFLANPTAPQYAALRLRCDILWSRVELLTQGQVGEQLRVDDEIQADIQEIIKTLKEFDRRLATEDAALIAAISTDFAALEGVIRTMNSQMAQIDNNTHKALEVELDKNYQFIFLASASGLVSGAALVIFVIIQARRSNRLAKELQIKIEEIHQLATHDPLTSLPNRKFFNERLDQALARARRTGIPVGLLMIDLDGFKAVNDTLGHLAGDQLLVEVARRLAGAVRVCDTVARLGGDEFVALLDTDVNAEGLAAVARKIVAHAATPFDLEAGRTTIGASVGGAIADGGDDADTIMSKADSAMYNAKRAGKNRYALFDDRVRETAG